MMDEIVLTPKNELRKLIADEINKAVSGIKPAAIPEKEVLNNREAMEFLGVSRSTLQRWREDGTIKFSKVAGTILYRRENLLSLLR